VGAAGEVAGGLIVPQELVGGHRKSRAQRQRVYGRVEADEAAFGRIEQRHARVALKPVRKG